MALGGSRPGARWDTSSATTPTPTPTLRDDVDDRDGGPTRDLTPDRIARGTRPQARQEFDAIDAAFDDSFSFRAGDADDTGQALSDPASGADVRDVFAARGAVASETGDTTARSLATPPADSDEFESEVPTTTLARGAAVALFAHEAPTRNVLAAKLPLPRPLATRDSSLDSTQPFEPEASTVALDRSDLPTRAISPRHLGPIRAATHGGVLAPVAFDDTKELTPRAAAKLARKTALGGAAVPPVVARGLRPPPVPRSPSPLASARAATFAGHAAASARVSRGSRPSTETLDQTAPFESEVSTVALLDVSDLATLEPADEPSIDVIPAGSQEVGPYLVHERLGAGGMGSVHRAELRGVSGFRKAIALKRMWPHLTNDTHLVQSFIQEARLASGLCHRNIVGAYDFGKLDDTYYIAMELVEGPTLAAAMKQAHRAAGAVPIAVTLDVLIQLCEALEYAHGLCDDSGRSLGLVHRDVSPANMILAEGGVMKLIDFGVAKSERSTVHTAAGIIKGKLAYVAPEYTEGKLDARADLWSVGVIAYELLTGQRLFLGEHDFETLRNVRDKPIYAPSRVNPQIGPDLDDIVLTALSRDPDARWQSASALRNALGGVAQELHLVLGGAAIREWVTWAFAQEPRRDTGIVRVLHSLDTPETSTPVSTAQATVNQLQRARSQRLVTAADTPPPPVAPFVDTPAPIVDPAPRPAKPRAAKRAAKRRPDAEATPRRELASVPFASSRVLERQRTARSSTWWLLLALVSIGTLLAAGIAFGWISESWFDDLGARVERLKRAFD